MTLFRNQIRGATRNYCYKDLINNQQSFRIQNSIESSPFVFSFFFFLDILFLSIREKKERERERGKTRNDILIVASALRGGYGAKRRGPSESICLATLSQLPSVFIRYINKDEKWRTRFPKGSPPPSRCSPLCRTA